MTRLKKVFLVLLGGLLLFLVAAATIRFGYVTMLAMLIATILVIFYYNEKNKQWETIAVQPAEQSFIDESRRRVKKKPWEDVD